MALEGALLGRYRLKRRLGAGGMAEVWEAMEEKFGRAVALKVVHEEIADEDEFHTRFLREARLAARLEHPHILSVTDYGTEGTLTWLAMPIRGGGTLATRMSPPPDRAKALSWLKALASALDFAHARGIIHRDVKPGNVLFDEEGNLCLADFGLAKSLTSTTRVTMDGSTVGTPAYMSPEQTLGKPLDGRTDQFSLALLAFRLLTGHLPIEDCPTPILLHRRAFDLSPLPSSVAPSLGASVDRVFARALAREPSGRFATCGDFVSALREALGERAGAATPPDEPGSGRRAPPPLPASVRPTPRGNYETQQMPTTVATRPPGDPPSGAGSEDPLEPPTFGQISLQEGTKIRWGWIAAALGVAFLLYAFLR